jgi:hypothetical protein
MKHPWLQGENNDDDQDSANQASFQATTKMVIFLTKVKNLSWRHWGTLLTTMQFIS